MLRTRGLALACSAAVHALAALVVMSDMWNAANPIVSVNSSLAAISVFTAADEAEPEPPAARRSAPQPMEPVSPPSASDQPSEVQSVAPPVVALEYAKHRTLLTGPAPLLQLSVSNGAALASPASAPHAAGARGEQHSAEGGATLASASAPAKKGSASRYASAVHRWIEARKDYPSELAARGLQGTAVISFELDRKGRVRPPVRLIQSSGERALDLLAQTQVMAASPFPRPPADASRADCTFTVPMSYRPQA